MAQTEDYDYGWTAPVPGNFRRLMSGETIRAGDLIWCRGMPGTTVDWQPVDPHALCTVVEHANSLCVIRPETDAQRINAVLQTFLRDGERDRFADAYLDYSRVRSQEENIRDVDPPEDEQAKVWACDMELAGGEIVAVVGNTPVFANDFTGTHFDAREEWYHRRQLLRLRAYEGWPEKTLPAIPVDGDIVVDSETGEFLGEIITHEDGSQTLLDGTPIVQGRPLRPEEE